MKKIIKSFIASFVLLMSTSSMAVVLNIDFDTGGPVTNFNLGSFDDAQTGAQFYRYNTTFASSAAPYFPGTSNLIPLVADALQIFAHVDTNTNELSFGIILEKPSGSGGGSFMADMLWSTPATLALVDDPNETGTIGDVGGITHTYSLTWINCCTDGLVISGFNPTSLSLAISNVTFSDLNQVIFLSPNGQSQNMSFQVSDQNPININIAPCNPTTDPNQCIIPNRVPEPGMLFLFGLGLAGLGFARRKKA